VTDRRTGRTTPDGDTRGADGRRGYGSPPGYGKDPWAHAPTEELEDQVLPRWFVLLAIAAVPAAIVTLVVAFVSFGPDEIPVAERRPPPAEPAAPQLTHDVGALELGEAEPVAYEEACPLLSGVRVAGTEADRTRLRRGLAALCNVAEADVADALASFAEQGGVVRFAAFEQTGIASVATVGAQPPEIYVNARYSRGDALQVAPLVAHDVIARLDPGEADAELAARIAEADVCTRLFNEPPPSCTDATQLTTLPNALTALRAAGYE
jgi:hypothetical protein